MTVIAALLSEESIQKAQKTLLPRRDQRTVFTSIRPQIQSQKRGHFTLPTPLPSQPLFKQPNKCSFLQQLPCTVICRENHYFRKAEFAIFLLTTHPWHQGSGHSGYHIQSHTYCKSTLEMCNIHI